MKFSEVMHRTQLVGGQVHLGAVRLVESSHQMTPEASYDVRHRVSTDINASAVLAGQHLQVTVNYVVRAHAEESDELAFTITMLWVLDYFVPPEAGITQLDAEAFAVVSGVMAAHPYAREHVQRSTSLMGFEALVLDVVRQGSLDEGSEDREVELQSEAQGGGSHSD